MISAFAIGTRVWLCPTEVVADDTMPSTLPLGSIILEVEQADALREQLTAAANKAAKLATVERTRQTRA